MKIIIIIYVLFGIIRYYSVLFGIYLIPIGLQRIHSNPAIKMS